MEQVKVSSIFAFNLDLELLYSRDFVRRDLCLVDAQKLALCKFQSVPIVGTWPKTTALAHFQQVL